MTNMFDSASTVAAAGLGKLQAQLGVLIKDVEDVDRLISEFVGIQTLKVVGK